MRTAPSEYVDIEEAMLSGFPAAAEMNNGRKIADKPEEIAVYDAYTLAGRTILRDVSPQAAAVIRAFACMEPGRWATAHGVIATGILDSSFKDVVPLEAARSALKQCNLARTAEGRPIFERMLQGYARTPHFKLVDNLVFVDSPDRAEFGVPLTTAQRRMIGRAMLTGATQPAAAPAKKEPKGGLLDLSSLHVSGAPDWELKAACKKNDTELFYADEPATEAKEVCVGCEVRGDCLAKALASKRNSAYGAA